MKLKWPSLKATDVSTMNDLSRTSNVKKQIGLSFIFKLLAIAFNFLLIPVTLKYLGQEQYGVWMTILTILSWVSFFDMGLGNGMRNRISEALAKGNSIAVRQYISSAYVAIGAIVFFAYLLFVIFASSVDWQHIFNVSSIDNKQLRNVMLLSSFVLFFNFLLSLINQVMNAYQQSSLTGVNQIIANGFALLFTYILVLTTRSSLLLVAFCYGFSLIIANIVVSWKFYIDQPEARPAVPFFRWEKVKDITGISAKFFIIQLATMMFFAKDNVMITQIMGPKYVTTYSIVYKIFSIVTFAHGILLGPLWSAYTDAYAKGDSEWIRSTMKKMNLLMIPISLCIFSLCILAPLILHYWIGDHAEEVEMSFIWLMGLFTIISVWNNNYGSFLNGTGKLRLSLYLVPLITILNIPLSIYLMQLYGLNGMVIATVASMLPGAILAPVQYIIILNEHDMKKHRILYKIFCK